MKEKEESKFKKLKMKKDCLVFLLYRVKNLFEMNRDQVIKVKSSKNLINQNNKLIFIKLIKDKKLNLLYNNNTFNIVN